LFDISPPVHPRQTNGATKPNSSAQIRINTDIVWYSGDKKMRIRFWILGMALVLFLAPLFTVADNDTSAVLPAGNVTATLTTPPSVSGNGNDYNSGVIELQTGWNLVGIPRRLAEDKNSASLFAHIESAGRSIWTFDPAGKGWKDLTAQDKLSPLDGYFIYSSKPDKVTLSYSVDPLQVPPVKDLQIGWNLVGFSGASDASARDSLLSIRKTWTQVIGWDPEKQRTEDSIINGGNDTHADSRMMVPMRAYWVYVDSPCSLASIGA
jgi:hypothetical protein